MDEILNFMPVNIKDILKQFADSKGITEIRIRNNINIILRFNDREVVLNYVASKADILNILMNISKNSIYSIQNDINNGFLTIKGGHRVGVTGEVVLENGKIKNIKNISSLNIRVARQIIGAADSIIKTVINNGRVNNTLIVSPPSCRKNDSA